MLFRSRLYTEGYKLRRGLEVYTGAYHRHILEKTVFERDKEYQDEVKEIEEFIGGGFTRWKTDTMMPVAFRASRVPPAKEDYRWVMPTRALQYSFSSTYTKKQSAAAAKAAAAAASKSRARRR